MSCYAGSLLLQSLTLTPGRTMAATTHPRSNSAQCRVYSNRGHLLHWPTSLCEMPCWRHPFALVAPLRESSLIIGSLFSYLLFREDISRAVSWVP